MKQFEMRSIIENAYRHNLDRAVLVMKKPKNWKLKGFKVRTPFGNCEVCNYQDKDDHVQIVFWAPVANILKIYRKLWPDDLSEIGSREGTASK